jgi:GntR family transcriptional regulator, carbon starvation induced regulator
MSKNSADAPSALTMAGAVYTTLRQDILRGALSPAAKLRIETLCQRYDVTSTPIREALNQLASEGFVQRREQRGFFVAEASPTELTQLTNTRCWVEPIALREAIAHRSTEWEERIVLAMHRLSRVSRSASSDRFVANPDWDAAHRVFHHALIAACPSRWLIDFCMLLSDHATRYRNLAMAVVYPNRDVAGEHRLLMEAVIGGDAEAATDRLVAHYRRTAEIIEAAGPHAAGSAAKSAARGKRNVQKGARK